MCRKHKNCTTNLICSNEWVYTLNEKARQFAIGARPVHDGHQPIRLMMLKRLLSVARAFKLQKFFRKKYICGFNRHCLSHQQFKIIIKTSCKVTFYRHQKSSWELGMIPQNDSVMSAFCHCCSATFLVPSASNKYSHQEKYWKQFKLLGKGVSERRFS